MGIVRLSGAELAIHSILERLAPARRSLSPREMTLVSLVDTTGVPFDRALMAHFPAPASYTGEHVVELHLHGNPVVLEQALDACIAAGARPAAPGEFTRRALAHGKLSLVEAEGVDALIRAPSREAARAAQRHLGGELDARLRAWIGRLLTSAVALEALVDFPDEVDESDVIAEVDQLAQLEFELRALLDTVRAGTRLQDGVRVALVGAVNAGKSTLLNGLLGHDRAIVSAMPGTTRDVVAETVEWDGVAYRLEDTAGLRETADPVEVIGIQRSGRAQDLADVLVFVMDGRSEPSNVPAPPATSAATPVAIATHADLCSESRLAALQEQGWICVDGPAGAGLDDVRAAIARAAGVKGAAGQLLLHTARQHVAMQAAADAVGEAAMVGLAEPVLAAVAVRRAGRALEELAGQWVDERVLDELFARFCIGK